MVNNNLNPFYSKEDRLTVKFINSTIRLGQRSGLKLWKTNSDAILNKARKKTGLEDFGNEKYFEVLDRLLEDVRKAEMIPLGEFFINFIICNTAMNRLKIIEYIKNHPEIKDIPIKSPLFIVGFPRTGTTLLQNVFSSGEGYRGLHLWEIATPYPLHEDRIKDKKKRIRRINLPLRLLRLGVAELNDIHDVRPDTKEECWLLLGNSLCITNIDPGTGFHDWNNWLINTDRRWAYEEYKRILQIQAHITPTEKFVLKCPTHIWNLKPLLEVFPDARIIWVHRNPVKSIASTSSIACLGRKFFFGYVDKKYVGKMIEDRFHSVVTEVMEFRKNINESQIYDVNFDKLIKDIPGTVRDVRKYFGFPHNEEHHKAVLEFLNRPRKDKPGKHKYEIEDFGLDPKEITERFSDYIQRFNIKV